MSNKLKNKQLKQVQNQAQDGRSMVEMLGVLAIVGVLSIGGIAGYSWGMDKHVANQILNEMNLNSLQLAMLLQKGNPDGVTLALGSPYDDENPTFSTVNYGFQYGCGENADVADPECEYINETRYFITALDLPERVQKMVAESAENLQYVTKVETDETEGFVTVFFDVDAGVTEYESRPEETEPHYTPTPEVTTTTTTTTTEATTPETTTTEPATTTQASTTTELTTTTTTVTTTTVTTTTSNGECKSNDDCAADEFCLSSNCSYVCNGHYDSGTTTEAESCKNGTYKCEKIDSYKAENKDSEHSDKYVMSKSSMNWWSAERFCKALPGNKRMVKISDLDCCNPNLGGTTTEYCYAKKEEGTCSSSNGLSDEIKALRKAENGSEIKGNHAYWLDDPWTSTTAGRNSCNAYYVNLYYGDVGGYTRDLDSYSALCE